MSETKAESDYISGTGGCEYYAEKRNPYRVLDQDGDTVVELPSEYPATPVLLNMLWRTITRVEKLSIGLGRSQVQHEIRKALGIIA